MLRAVIIDDEQSGIETIRMLASRNADAIRIVASSLNGEEGITLIEDYKPDVVFLDIHMPSMNGFELLDRLTFRSFNLVFTTAYMEYAFQAIKNRAFDYLLKPISDPDFRTCIDGMNEAKAQTVIKHNPHLYLEIPMNDGLIYLKQKDIVRLEASRSYSELHLDNGIKHVASKSLSELESKLDSTLFFRCHKSHLVNLLKVQKIVLHNGIFALMSDGTMPLISRSLKDVFQQRLRMI